MLQEYRKPVLLVGQNELGIHHAIMLSQNILLYEELFSIPNLSQQHCIGMLQQKHSQTLQCSTTLVQGTLMLLKVPFYLPVLLSRAYLHPILEGTS